MTRISCMYPGSSGSSHNVNKNSPGNGNGKWQGLPGLTNMRSSLVIPTKKRAYGDNRNQVFCMNQLGGIGRRSNMFASNADGVKQPCQGGSLHLPRTTPIFLRSDQYGLSQRWYKKGSFYDKPVSFIYNALTDATIFESYKSELSKAVEESVGPGSVDFY